MWILGKSRLQCFDEFRGEKGNFFDESCNVKLLSIFERRNVKIFRLSYYLKCFIRCKMARFSFFSFSLSFFILIIYRWETITIAQTGCMMQNRSHQGNILFREIS